MMHTTFYWSKNAIVLVDSWQTESWASYLLTLLALFASAAFSQYMEDRRVRFRMLVAAGSKPTPPPPALGPPLLLPSATRLRNPDRLASSLLYGVNSAIGYLLMLAVMSFNAGVFIAVVVGLAVGYLLFRSGGEKDYVASFQNPCACS